MQKSELTREPVESGDQPKLRLRRTREKHYTLEPIKPGDFDYAPKEFGRTKDVEHVFSVKRGTLYNAEKLGLVRGVLLRLRGQKANQ